MKKGIAFAGNLIVDQIKFVETYPAPGTLTTITEMTRAIGGLACNCVVDMARLDPSVPLKVLGIAGEDEAGDYILRQLSQYPSIDVSGILREGNTSYTDVITQSDGNRTFFHFRGTNAIFGPEHFDFSKLEADILHIGYILLLDRLDSPDEKYPTAMCRVLDKAKAHGIETSIDVVSEDSDRFSAIVAPALRYADYCIINEIEAARTTGIELRDGDTALEENLLPCLRKLADFGVAKWAVIHMPEMSCGYDSRNDEYFMEPSWKIPPGFKRSSVGAGDAFAGGILYGAYNGWDLRKSLQTAGAIAAYSLSGLGASDAIKPLEEIMAEMETYQ